MNYGRNKKYFKSTSITPWVILIIVGLLMLSANKIVGFIMILGGAALIFLKIKGTPTDAEIDAICKSEIENAVKKGLSKIGIDEEQVQLIEPIVINGPCFENIAKEYLTKKGKDGRLRSSNYEFAVLLFSENQVYSYNYRFSLIENERNEKTDEYFYKDIVSVSTSSDNVKTKNKKGKEEVFNLEYFRLTTSGGTSISCSVWDVGGTERSIQGMKQLLREKKSA
ncbi:hypothetical protein ACFQI7_32105 [Paenibacillus allorhizosphaerae]|uniref:Lipoprotein n=1 Tax=Paenibacillus allorhizosphaerae TaxID=2849866 RepID=A0ABM8VQC3_9BACL|nr:hypothetical protein [Paenibacillus allorhizosphaerae]CAG7654004.1 hypothetical protein PAECIP111802_05648 [Paenibacillus allorhizosphaerae]